jgi:triosephosphate isomerase (TIM)
MRKKIVAGNWKMNLSKNEALNLYQSLQNFHKTDNLEVSVFAPFIYLDALNNCKNEVGIGAQNFYPEEKGAFTGEVSISQLKDLGITKVLVGHSERRSLFNEDNELIKYKVDKALALSFDLIYCCGEPIEIREEKRELHYVYKQLELNLFHLSKEELKKVVIAYEPIWAIGTGKTATTEQAEEMHRNIRMAIADKYDQATADSISILYGGSCNAANASELFACANIDGGLIGGASLKLEDFIAIINAMK